MNTVRVILSLAVSNGWDLLQFDVKNAFLHGDLEEEIYMELPLGYVEMAVSRTVYKLEKALYGFLRAWFGRFSNMMTSLVINRVRETILFFSNTQFQGK